MAESKWTTFTNGVTLNASDLNNNFDFITDSVNAVKLQAEQPWCADCFSKDYKTKTPAVFIAHGFSVCEDCFKRYCENQKKVYEKAWRANQSA